MVIRKMKIDDRRLPQPGARDPGARRKPRQARSQATEEALLDAGLACIEEFGIDATPMTVAAERAGVSIGAIYFRFGDKEGFIQAALQYGFNQIRADTEVLLAQAVMQDKSPEDVIGAFVELAVQVQSSRQRLFRAVLKRALDDPGAWDPVGHLGIEMSSRLVDTLQRFPVVTAIPDWKHKVLFGIHAARTAHFNSLYNAQAPLPADHSQRIAELRGLVVSFLGLPVDGAKSRSHKPKRRADGTGHQPQEI